MYISKCLGLTCNYLMTYGNGVRELENVVCSDYKVNRILGRVNGDARQEQEMKLGIPGWIGS